MANTKISDLTAASALAGTETIPVVQGGTTKKATGQQLMTLITGSTTLTGATITTSKPLIDHAQTWNDGAVAFTAWKLNVTNSASDGASLLVDLQVGGSSVFSIESGGGVTADWLVITPENSSTGVSLSYYDNGMSLAQYGLVNWFSTTLAAGAPDLGIGRAAAGILDINAGALETGGAALQMREMTAPSAPASNGVRLYAEDNGAGKTRLMAIFSSGAAQQVAIQP